MGRFVVQAGCMIRSELSGFEVHVRCGKWMLYCLVLSDRSTEDYSFSRVLRGSIRLVSDRWSSMMDQCTFSVLRNQVQVPLQLRDISLHSYHAAPVEFSLLNRLLVDCTYDLETLTLFANERIGRYSIVVKEHLISIHSSASHLSDLSHVKPRLGPVRVDEEQRQPFGRFLDLLQRCCSREQYHFCRYLRRSDPSVYHKEESCQRSRWTYIF